MTPRLVSEHYLQDGTRVREYHAHGPHLVGLYETGGEWQAADHGGWVEGVHPSVDAALQAALTN